MTDQEAMEAAERKVDDLIEAWRNYEEGGVILATYNGDDYRAKRAEIIACVATVLRLETVK